MSTISVLVPAYNAARRLPQTIESVLSQQGEVDFELILVDDASTDETGALCDEAAARDDRVRVVHRRENGGEGPARNSGLDVMSGDWLLMLDADDLLEPQALATLGAAVDATDADALVYRFGMFDDQTGFSWDCPEAFQTGWFVHDGAAAFDPRTSPDHLYTAFWSSVCNKCFRTSFLREHALRFDDTPRIGDVFFTLSGLSLARSIAILDAHLYRYRVNLPGSLTNTGDSYPLTYWRACSRLRQLLVERDVWDTYRIAFLNWVSENLPYNLMTMKSAAGYRALLEAFQKGGFEELGFGSFSREQAANPWAYDHCVTLWHASVEDGLFDFMKRKAREVDELADQRRVLAADLERARGDARRVTQEVARVQAELDAVRGSVSFRAGRALTAPLRALRDATRHG